MVKVWRSLFGLERRPVDLLNGARCSSFRKKRQDFVKECKTPKKLPYLIVFIYFNFTRLTKIALLNWSPAPKKRQLGSRPLRRKPGSAN
ncbi:MAG: hypothetical protein COB25_007530 [Oceanospirillales bacterium]|jgi:hypothetical protein|nr:hypothetical protein [Oceanospirillales bacterium]